MIASRRSATTSGSGRCSRTTSACCPRTAADELMRTALGADDAVAPAMPSLPLPATVDDARRTRIFGRDAELAPARCTPGRRRGRAPRPRGRSGRNRQESTGVRSGGARVRTRLHRHLRSVSRRPRHSVRRDRRRVHRGPAHTGCRRSLRASRRRRRSITSRRTTTPTIRPSDHGAIGSRPRPPRSPSSRGAAR